MKRVARVVNTHEAKTHLSRLIDDALNGEEIILARAGKPLIRLVPIRPASRAGLFGSAKGQIVIHDSFYEDLPEDMWNVYTGADEVDSETTG